MKRLVGFHEEEGTDLRLEILLSAIPWPSGLEIILGSSAFNCPRHEIMLEEAILDKEQESVQLLLTHGWPIHRKAFEFATVLAYKPELFQIIVAELYQRRRHLLHLVKTNLTPKLLSELGISDGTKVLDCDSHLLHAHLGDHPQVVLEEIFPVYQNMDRNIQAANTLYEAGFTNVDAGEISPFLGYSHYVPQYLESCSWLQDKGGSIYRSSRGTDILPVHSIAAGLVLFLDLSWKKSTDWRPVIARHTKLLRDVLTDTAHRDSCSCACSGVGCLPSDVLMRDLIWFEQYGQIFARSPRSRVHHMTAEFIEFLCSQSSDSAISVCESMAPAVFRSCLFNELDITHTCQSHDYRVRGPFSEEKRREITRLHSEQSHLIYRLEELVAEVDAKYKEMNVPLPEFLTGWFDTKLQELRAEENIFDEEEAQRMRSIGVILEETVQ